ncbi:YeaC family protein [Zooshikella sp. RANM57]|uniref:YeaC family protein n=1 Tax=Zooshikella sp. RANM57 TaxID=3425863 RepID=UPI003D6F9145
MDFSQLLDQIDAETYQRLKTAVEIRKWPDGRVLTPSQVELCLQAVIAYEHKHLPVDQHSGFISQQCASQTKLNTEQEDSNPQPVNII